MKERVITGLAILFVVLVMFLTKIIIGTPIIFDLFIGMILIIGCFELTNILNKTNIYNHGYLIMAMPIAIYAVLILTFNLKLSLVYTILCVLGVIVLFLFISYFITLFSRTRTENEMRVRKIRTGINKFAIKKSFNTMFGYIYPTIPVMFLIVLNHLNDFNYLTGNSIIYPTLTSILFCALCFLIPFICDTFSYLTGMLIGGKKLAPNISPNKTISGAIGGVAWTVLLLLVSYFIFSSGTSMAMAIAELGITWWHILILGFVGSIICILGDLFESYLKRKANVKDSGDLLAGHGGILDRIDGFTLVIPVVFIFALLFI